MADRLECEAWNAIMWAGGPAMPSPGEPQAEPTIAKAINGGYVNCVPSESTIVLHMRLTGSQQIHNFSLLSRTSSPDCPEG